jgi:hypothetical protein
MNVDSYGPSPKSLSFKITSFFLRFLRWYGHVKQMQEERLPKLIMEWIPGKRRKRGCPRKTWLEGVRAAMKTKHLEADQWLNRKEWCLGSGRRRQLSQEWKDR